MVFLGTVPSQHARNQLTLWMAHAINDIAVFRPSGKLPIVVAAYITPYTGPKSKCAATLAEAGSLVTASLTSASRRENL